MLDDVDKRLVGENLSALRTYVLRQETLQRSSLECRKFSHYTLRFTPVVDRHNCS